MELLKSHPQWVNLQFVCQKLALAGFEAYLAGGAVRDALLGVSPGDLDVATDATPDQVEGLFENTVAVGKAFGVIVVPFPEGEIEIATFRSDGSYRDGRRPDFVQFSSPKEDAQRRDFTVNALFYDLKKEQVLDDVGGQKDLQEGVLRTVGEPRDRFAEDGLRLLRAVRFAAQVGLRIEENTYNSIRSLRWNLKSVSIERVRDEMQKMMRGPRPVMAFQLLVDLSLAEVLFGDVDLSIFEKFKKRARWWREENVSLLWATLYSEKWLWFAEGKSSMTELRSITSLFVRSNLRDWKLSAAQLNEIEFLLASVLIFKCRYEHRFTELRRWFSQSQNRSVLKFLKLFRYDFLRELTDSDWKNLATLCEPLPTSLLVGKDLKAEGLAPGPIFKRLLDECLDLQLEGKIESRRQALDWLKERILE